MDFVLPYGMAASFGMVWLPGVHYARMLWHVLHGVPSLTIVLSSRKLGDPGHQNLLPGILLKRPVAAHHHGVVLESVAVFLVTSRKYCLSHFFLVIQRNMQKLMFYCSNGCKVNDE